VSDAALPPTADRRRYLIGFALAPALTVIPFAAVYLGYDSEKIANLRRHGAI
jgi:heme/copper-type cytochrome/quinol oxidase subunit 4